jgi:hypothetical protein
MGYQNDERPDDLNTLVSDVSADLLDLRLLIKYLVAINIASGATTLDDAKTKLIESIDFMRESMRRISAMLPSANAPAR